MQEAKFEYLLRLGANALVPPQRPRACTVQ